MPYYNFQEDFAVAQKTEQEISTLMLDFYGWKTVEFCDNSDYDLLLEKGQKRITAEIKEDFLCEKTGNVGVEFFCRNKPSGISTTNAMFYIYKIHTKNGIEFRGILTKDLKMMIENCLYHRVVDGGDIGSGSYNYLFKYEIFSIYSEKLFSPDGISAQRQDKLESLPSGNGNSLLS